MLTIMDNHDLRNGYSTLDLYYEVLNEVRTKMPEKDVSPLLNSIKEAKRDIRRYLKWKSNSDRHLVKDYGIDGYIELVEFPDSIKTEDEAKDYFESEERLICRPSVYDCTGQLFTGWYKLFMRRVKWMCYHRVSCDV